ncbi:hypothetical protein GFY24_01655 [Nocardia sp. SYP-A9097]|uniref:hypothetical protein n=1 Tax=Nocardia sp. SYP-A9097 TaxID=2663237 RepID=UPI00129BA455|nr:hypothetical protein [Nocardia sp. SYP-A9097]MRH86181.1 hypothetical protein [Nocardia sp. SYP-A9097]
MTSTGQPGPGKKVTLPSGALWEGGPTAGTSLITLPDGDPILVADNGSGISNSIVGRSGPFGAMARVFEEVLGHVPSFFANRVAAQALELVRGLPEAHDREIETRIVKFSSKATLLNPARSRSRSGSSNDRDDAETFAVDPIRRANGGYIDESEYRNRASGMVRGPGGPLGDGVPLRASDGEYVVKASAVDNTLPLLEMINAGWVPTAQFLTGMLSGFATPAATSPTGAQNWRDLLGQGVIADTIGSIGNAAANTGAWAGAALGSALAPMFQPGGLLVPRPGSGASTALPRDSAESPSGVTASMQATPSGILGMFGGAKATGTARDGTELTSLAQALGSGIASAATAAGSNLGAALGNAIKPALGPGGELAPQIGEQLGRLIGSQFGGALTASMSVKTEGGQLSSGSGLGGGTSVGAGTSTGGGTSSGDGSSGGGDTGGPEPTSDGGGGGTSVVDTSGPAGGSGGGSTDTAARWEYLNGQDGNGNPISGWAYLVPKSDQVGVLPSEVPDGMAVGQYIKDDGTGPIVRDVPGTSWIDTLTGKSDPAGAQDLVGTGHRYNPNSGNFGDLLQVAANQAGGDLGELLKPVLGENAPDMVKTFAEQLMKPIGDAYNAADPNHDYSNTLGTWVGNLFGIKWTPNGQSSSSNAGQLSHEQQVGVAAFESGVEGLQQHGLLGGLTGAISGAASTGGSLIGGAIGTAIAPFLGPAAALGPAIGSFLGSMAGGVIASEFTRPIEWAGNAIKELVGTGFGLTDLADGPGGHTVRGDIYNFNGTDPKSASIATERVRRRRAVAQQRGGGMGR